MPEIVTFAEAAGRHPDDRPAVANQRRVRPGGLMRCCLATLAEAVHETLPGDVLACKYEPDATDTQMVVAADGVWEWNQ